jgi:NTP pyrophosphatase (non-canonical NTP hydrolase)
MDFDEYQRRVSETAIYPDAGSSNIQALMYCAGSATGEAGEVWGQVKKAYRDDHGQVTDAREKKIKKEIGDTLWYVAQLCNELCVSGSEVMETNLAKLSLRAKTGTLGGDGDDREHGVAGHLLEVTEEGAWLLGHLRCKFGIHVCPVTLAAKRSRQGDPPYEAASPAVYSAATNSGGELVLFRTETEAGLLERGRQGALVHPVIPN